MRFTDTSYIYDNKKSSRGFIYNKSPFVCTLTNIHQQHHAVNIDHLIYP